MSLDLRKAFEDAVWDLGVEMERDAHTEPYPNDAKSRQDACFARVMAQYDALARRARRYETALRQLSEMTDHSWPMSQIAGKALSEKGQ